MKDIEEVGDNDSIYEVIRYAGLETGNAAYTGISSKGAEWLSVTFLRLFEIKRSPCERLVTDYVPFYELLEVLAEEVAVQRCCKSRVCRLTGEETRDFLKMVIERFFGYGEKCGRGNHWEKHDLFGVYLLSADRFFL